MKRSLSLTIIGASLVLAAAPSLAAVKGGSSNSANVDPASSLLFGLGNAGLVFNGGSAAIDLAGGPIAMSNKRIINRSNSIFYGYTQSEVSLQLRKNF